MSFLKNHDTRKVMEILKRVIGIYVKRHRPDLLGKKVGIKPSFNQESSQKQNQTTEVLS